MFHKTSVLYLEDDEDLGRITTLALRSEMLEVVWEKNGIDGLARFKAARFDACVIDIMLPGMDGYTLVKAIRAIHPTIPVIFLSARVLTEDVVKGFQVGGDDYVRKPFSVEELVARVRRLGQRASVASHGRQPVQIGGYRFYPESNELRGPQRTVCLSARAGELLYRLATNEDRTLKREETLLELWGEATFFNGRSLDVFISKIRRHLAADPGIRIITIRGYGYRLALDSP